MSDSELARLSAACHQAAQDLAAAIVQHDEAQKEEADASAQVDHAQSRVRATRDALIEYVERPSAAVVPVPVVPLEPAPVTEGVDHV